jgi:rhamnosyltransferase
MLSKKNNTCAIIVTYNPEVNRVNQLIKQLNEQDVDAVIVDNSPDIIEFFSDKQYIWLGGNKGIATAQNKGLDKVIADEYKYVIFFDQDSNIQAGFISALLEPMVTNDYEVCAPVFFDEKKGFEYAITDIKPSGLRRKIFSVDKTKSFTTSVAISSGTIVKSSLFSKVGAMDERLFIDYVDTEWCLRCSEFGVKVNVIPTAKMLHSIGDKSVQFLNFRVPVHSPYRRYYRVRNSIHLLRYSHVPKLMALREIFFSCIHSLILISTQPKKLEYAKYFIYALLDGLRNIWGKCKHVPLK